MPTIAITSVSVTSPRPAGQPLTIGDTLALTLATDQSIDSLTPGPGGASPTLSLSNGAMATFTGFDAAGLHFAYIVQAGQTPAQDTGDLSVTGLALNGASLNHTATVGFAPWIINAVGSQPTSVTSADLNGDGKADLVGANPGDNTLSVLLGNGDGSVQTRVTYATGSNPVSVTSADLNGDGKADLVSADQGSNTLSVLLGNGDGTFAPQVSYAVGIGPFSLTSADVNGDGRLDLVGANSGDNTLSVLLGNGDSTFQTQVTYATGSNPVSVVSADLEGDGRLDLVVANRGGNTLSVLLGNGDGTFLPQTTYATGALPVSVTSADLNGDGRLDLVVANSISGTLAVLLGNGDGTFQSKRSYDVGRFPASVTSADVNGDGRLDLISANYDSNTLSVLLGNGDGTFAPQTTYAVGRTPNAVTSADLDGDGRPDLVSADFDSRALSILLNISTPAASLDAASFAAASGRDTGLAVDATAPQVASITPSSAATNATSLTETVTFSEAVTGLDVTDLIVTTTSGTAFGHVASVSGSGASYTVTLDRLSGTGTIQLDLKDGGTGIRDGAGNLIAAGYTGGETAIAHPVTVTGVAVASPEPAGRPLKIGDTLSFTLATDQVIDSLTPGAGGASPTLTLSNGATATFTGFDAAGLHFAYTVQAGHAEDTGDLSVSGLSLNGASLNRSASLSFAPQTTETVGDNPYSVTSADLNGDGRLDLVSANYGSDTLSVLLGNGDGSFKPQTTVAVGNLPASVTTTDLNGDGRLDLVSANSGSGTLSVLLGNGDGTFQPQTAYAVGLSPISVTSADLNGDGRLDLVSAEYGSNALWVMLGNGDGGFQAQTSYVVGDNPTSVTSADLNGDGRLDLVSANALGNNLSVLLGNGDGTFKPQTTVAVGQTPQSVTGADLNGDGRSDLVSANYGSNNLSVLLGKGDGTFQPQVTYAVGINPASVTTADVDGDGVLDLVGANSTDNTLSILLGKGDGSFRPQTTVAVGSTPNAVTSADLDGDGRPDLVSANLGADTLSVVLNGATPAATLDAASLATAIGRDTGLAVDATAPLVQADAAAGTGVAAALTGNLLANDSDASGLQLAGIQFADGLARNAPASGTVTLSGDHGLLTVAADGSYRYQPTAPGHDVFLQTVTDGAGNTSQTSLTFDVAKAAIPASLSFGFALTQAQFDFRNGHDLMTAPDGTLTDLTGVGTITFSDGTVTEADGSPLVDDLFYFAKNLDVWAAHVSYGLDAETHYDAFGWHEGRDPDAYFSTSGYLALYPDVAAAGINPLTHYDLFGWHEGRSPSLAFSAEAYRALYPDVAVAGVSPLTHYLTFGQAEGRVALPGLSIGSTGDHLYGDFDASFYLAHNPDVAAAAPASGLAPDSFAFTHYLIFGAHEGRDPDAYFSTNGYLAANPDAAATGINPLLHYGLYGWHEGRDPSALFDTNAYLAANPDVAAANVDPLQHYLQFGLGEGRHLA